MDRLAEEDILLLQISSDYPAGIAQKTPYPATGMMWGDAGSVYYAIGDADLKARNFAQANYSIDRMISEHKEMYDKCMQGN